MRYIRIFPFCMRMFIQLENTLFYLHDRTGKHITIYVLAKKENRYIQYIVDFDDNKKKKKKIGKNEAE